MGKQESVTLADGSLRVDGRTGDGEPGAAAGGPGPGGAGGFPGRWISRFRSLSRGRRLAITTSAGVLAVATAITAIASTSGRAAKAPAHPQAPAFTLPALGSSGHSGGHISLAGFAGKPLIINFFASWCEPCQKETPLLARFYRAAHGSVTLIGVDANDKASAALKFIHAAGVSYPVAFDPYPMHTTISFGVDALPQTFFLDARHRIVKLVRGAVTEQELDAGVAQITGQTRG
jgi:cytochrome c biogenesis protein CcmG, thiol:disulfide interchange protein DsbE